MSTDRIALPLLAAAQAQKEMTHNEALALLDIAVQPVVEEVGPASVPASPSVGQCWIVGASPGGAWTGRAHAIAGWTAGGWRFVAPLEGMRAWSISDNCEVRFAAGGWLVGAATATALFIGGEQVIGARGAHVAAPTGGITIDAEARTAIENLLEKLQEHGLIAAS